MKKVGLTWLQDNLNIQGFQLTHESYIGKTEKTELSSNGAVVQTYKSKYDVRTDDPMLHLEFALKYDDLNLPFIKEVFSSIDPRLTHAYIKANPNRKYPRIIGYLYEFTGDKAIDVKVTSTNYLDLLDASKYVTGNTTKVSKWKINDNLLGTKEFCPVIRRTAELSVLLDWNIEKEIQNLENEYSSEIFNRASYYLYKKESKSSSEIEKEEPSRDRLDRFISLLEEAGKKSFEESLSEKELIRIQNIIVDSRYADKGFRDFQNYVGQLMRDYTQKIHYVCPPPQYVKSLMLGLVALNKKNTRTEAIIKAAMTSFAFVYIHPFADGNGRIHRYLIHDILVRDGIVPNSTIIPVSTQILSRMNEYDAVLESFSSLIEKKTKYYVDDTGKVIVKNAVEIEALYRFPDLSNQVIFLIKTIQSTLKKDVPEELHFLQCYDELKREIQWIVDMPDNKIDRMILFLHQNNGKLSGRKRKFYEELSGDEIHQMEEAYTEVFKPKNTSCEVA